MINVDEVNVHGSARWLTVAGGIKRMHLMFDSVRKSCALFNESVLDLMHERDRKAFLEELNQAMEDVKTKWAQAYMDKATSELNGE